MIAEQRLHFPILLFISLLLASSRLAISKQKWNFNVSLWNSTARLPTFWINKPFVNRNYSITDFSAITPILLSGNSGPQYLCGFFCNYEATECLLGILSVFYNSSAIWNKYTFVYPQLVWSANRNRPVKTNATLQLGRDGNLVLADSDGTLVWSTNTAGKSVSGLNLTETGNLVLFDKRKRTIWQSFDHPTDSLFPGQNLVSGQKLIASVSASNWSQGLLSLTILNGSLVAYADTSPPQYYYASQYYMNDTRLSFDGQTLSLVYFDQFMKLEHNGHLRIYRFDRDELDWKVESDVWTYAYAIGNCGYPMESRSWMYGADIHFLRLFAVP
ncbi:hypothetical protein HAX54_008116 [Datura stramonium]|uniref:Bulb-type lectin domain-containing protein n=1 Tax=Datura stramonium TaxID=4076 RepID=A0ABS8TE23_DATST|nr:hypothetical protein [Datura stramonium]